MAATTKNVGIVAVVNGEAITSFALQERIDMIVQSSGLSDSPDIRRRLVSQAIHSIINETLQRQHAQEIGLSITDADLKRAMVEIEQKNNLPTGGFDNFVKEQGLNKNILLDQINTQILWQKIVQARIHPRLTVSDFEVRDMLDSLKSKQNNPEVYLSGIFIPITESRNKVNARIFANELLQEIENGADFSVLAKQFSASNTAAQGGVIGWIAIQNLDKTVQEVLETLEIGEVSKPIEGEEGYRIIKLGSRRGVDTGTLTEGYVREALMRKKMELESRRYMKNLRTEAFIEMRL